MDGGQIGNGVAGDASGPGDSLVHDRARRGSCLSRTRDGGFGVAFVLSKEASMVSFQTMVAFAVLEMLQMASFPVSLMADSPSIKPFSTVLTEVASGAFGRIVQAVGFTLILTVVLVVAVVFLGLVATVAVRFISDSPQSKPMLRLLRAMASLLTTVLFLPMAGVLMRVFVCESDRHVWDGVSLECEGSGHLVLQAFVGLVLLLWVATSLLVTTTLVDDNPASKSFAAKIHGRMDALVILIKLALTFVWSMSGVSLENVAEAAPGQLLGIAALLAFTGVVWMASFAYFLPFMQMKLNAFIVATSSVYLWCSLTVLLTLAAPGAHFDPGLSVLLGSIGVGVAAYMTTMYRVQRLSRLSMSAAKGSSVLLETWARVKLHVLLDDPAFDRFARSHSGPSARATGHTMALGVLVGMLGRERSKPTKRSRRIANKHWRTQDPSPASGFRSRPAVVGVAPPTVASTAADDDAKSLASLGGGRVREPDSPRSAVVERPARRGASGRDGGSGSRHQSGLHQEQLEKAIEGTELDLALFCLDQSVAAHRLLIQAFPNSELAAVRTAAFWQMYSPFLYPEMLALRRAAQLNSGIDTQYHVFMRLKQTQGIGGNGRQRPGGQGGSMTVIDRLMVDQQTKQISKMQQSSYRSTARLWQCLAEGTVDLKDVADAGMKLNHELNQLDTLFESVMQSGAASTTLMRNYASFLRDQRSNPTQAMELLNKADRIDEAKSRRRGRPLRHCHFGMVYDGRLDENDERAAVMMVSGDDVNLGEVLQVSVGACRLLGARAPQELVGTTVHEIVPPPLRGGHPAMMRNLSLQVNSYVLNHPRLLFVSTLNGTVVPAWTRVGEAPPDKETAAPRFMAVMEPVISREQHLFIGLDSDDFRIYAGSAGALETLGIGPELLRTDQEPIPVTSFIPSVSADDCPFSVVCATDGVSMQDADHQGRSRRRRGAAARPLSLGGKAGGASAWNAAAASNLSLLRDLQAAGRAFRLLQGCLASVDDDACGLGGGVQLPGTNNIVSEQSDTELRVELTNLQDLASQPDTDTIIPIRATTKSGAREWQLFVGSMEVVSRGGVSFGILRWLPFESAAVSWQALGGSSIARRSRLGRRSPRPSHSRAQPGRTGGPMAPPRHASAEPRAEAKQQAAPADGDDDSMLGSLGDLAAGGTEGQQAHLPGSLAGEGQGEGEGDDSSVGEPMLVDPTGIAGASSLEDHSRGFDDEPQLSLTATKPSPDGGKTASDRHVAFPPGDPSPRVRRRGRQPEGGASIAVFSAESRREAAVEDGADAPAQEPRRDPSASRSQTSTGTSDTARLARVLKAQLSKALPEVTRIRLVILAVTIFCLLVGLSDIAWLQQTSDGLRGIMSGVVLSGQRMVTAQEATISLYYIVVTTGGIPVRVLAEEQQHLLALSEQMRELNTEIYLAGSAFGANAALFESQVPLPVVQLRDMAGVHGITAGFNEPPPPNTTHGLTAANASMATFPCLSYEQCSRHALSFLAHTTFDFWLEAAEALRISSIGSAHELSVEEAGAAAAENGAEHLTIAYSRDPDVLELQLAEVAAQEYISSAVPLPLWQYTEYVASTLDSIAHAPPEALGYFYRDLRDCLANDGMLISSLQESLELRATELSLRFPQVTTQLLVAGAAAFLVAATMQSVLLAALINRIAQRTRKVLRLLLLVPRSTCRSLQGKSTKRFQQLLAEQDDSGFSDSDDSNSGSSGGSDLDGDGRAAEASSLLRPDRRAKRPTAPEGAAGIVPQHGVTGSELDRRLLGAQLHGDTNRATSVSGGSRRPDRQRRSMTGKKVVASLRSHTDSSNFVCYHVSLFTAPTLLILVWLGALAIYQTAQYHHLEELSHRSIIAALMSRRSFEYYTSMADTVLAEDGHDRLGTTLASQTVDRELLHLAQVFMFGGEIELPATGAVISVGPIEPSMGHYDIFVAHGCAFSQQPEACGAVEDGAMLAGLYTALHKMVHIGRRLISKLPETHADPNVPLVYGFHPGPWQDLARMSPVVDPHLTDALEAMLKLIEAEMLETLDQVQSVSLRVTIAFDALMLLWVVFAMYAAPKLAKPLHSARGLLAVVPSSVRDGVQGLRLAARDMASDPAMTLRSVDFEPSSTALQSHDRSCCASVGLARRGGNSSASAAPAAILPAKLVAASSA